MKTALYLIPVACTSKGWTLEYHIVHHRIDRRTAFCKLYAAYLCADPVRVIDIITRHAADKVLVCKGDRLILANAAAAYSFGREMGFSPAPYLGF